MFSLFSYLARLSEPTIFNDRQMEEIFIFEDRVFNLGRKIGHFFKIKCSKFKQDPLIIQDFFIFCYIFSLPKR